jgi:hypothetical protein
VLATIVLVAAALAQAALAVKVHVRVEGKTQNLFGLQEPTVDVPANALDALTNVAQLGEFYVHVQKTSFGPYVDQIGLFPAAGSGGWVFKLDGVSPQVGADQVTLKDGDTLVWYWTSFDPTTFAGAKTLVLKRTKPNCYAAFLDDDKGALTPAEGATLHVGLKRSVSTSAGAACVPAHKGLLVRATLDGAVRSNALQ